MATSTEACSESRQSPDCSISAQLMLSSLPTSQSRPGPQQHRAHVGHGGAVRLLGLAPQPALPKTPGAASADALDSILRQEATHRDAQGRWTGSRGAWRQGTLSSAGFCGRELPGTAHPGQHPILLTSVPCSTCLFPGGSVAALAKNEASCLLCVSYCYLEAGVQSTARRLAGKSGVLQCLEIKRRQDRRLLCSVCGAQ